MAVRKRKHPADDKQLPADIQSSGSEAASAGGEDSVDKTARAPSPAVLPIVAIGASAGGLEALQEFFSKMPADCGMGFVVITHVRPGRESLMPELLAHVTDMQVVATEDDIRVEPNKIIVAKDSLLDISGGVMRSAEGDSTPETMYHPIDHFFRALAADQQEHAICIVLSGSGNDGTLGVKAIKAAGGMVMVQDSASAKYPAMPDSAQATGLADYALPPGQMPAVLVEYCRGPYLKLAHPAEAVALPDDAIQAVLVRLRAHSGQDFTCYKRSTMSRRIERRMNVHHIHEPREYVRFLRENPRELDILRQELLISVTSFFRDPEAFEALAEKGMAPQLAEHQDGQTYRTWIPGCATGEEAYSIAMLLHEQLRKAERLCEVQIFATDLDEQAIDIARGGLYPEGIGADVSQQRLSQFFSREDGAFRIHKNIRDMIVFAVQNVVSDAPFTRMDMVVCRNLLIYLDALAQQRVLQAFHYALRPGGLLFLGTSESTGEASRLFDVIDGKNKVLRRKEVPGDAQLAPGVSIRPHARREKGQERAAADVAPGLQVSRSIERLLLERFAPAAAVVDEQGTITYVHGRLGQYLEPEQGQPRNNILEMAREGLGPTLVTALRKAKREGREILHRSIRVRTNGDHVHVDLSVRPLTAPETVRGLLLVTFQPAGEPVPPSPQTEQEAAHEATAREQMERELQYTRENLQTTIEELQTANEELKSSNEELQSTNEELQSGNEELETSREEMQSLNEELNTVNAELQSKVSALARVNDDMTNLLNSMQVATIFLDRDLKVKRYTNKARDIIRLIESDIGRPLSDLTSSLRYGELVEDCGRVLASLVPQEKEVQDDTGQWYQVRLMPYRTSDNVIDGVVLSLVDISQTKQGELKARAGRAYFESIVQTVRQPLIVLDGNLRAVTANEAFYRTFDTQPRGTQGVLIYDLGNHQWDIPELRQLLEKILPERNVMTDFRVEHDFPGAGRRTFLLNARRLQQDEKEPALILLVFEDVTEGAR